LPLLLSGKEQPASPAERIALAYFSSVHKKCHAAAARFYADAFAEQPELATNPNFPRRYSAACSAALAGCRQGKDAANLSEDHCARLRKQALEWLHADLGALDRLLANEPGKARPLIVRRMQHLQTDGDFAGMRDNALTRLPSVEQQAWQQLWVEVANLLARAQGKTVPARKPDPK
jgi:hypothetical protein